ncbi:MAG: ABC transporter permease [Bacillota bacterium]
MKPAEAIQTTPAAPVGPATAEKPRAKYSPLAAFWDTYRSSSYGLAGLVLLGVIVLAAVAAPILAPYDPSKLGDQMLGAPSLSHLMGTDGMGRDILSEIIFGTRISLMVGFTSAIISAFIGTIVGAVSGFFGGLADEVISKVIDVFLLMPTFFLILIIVAMFGNSLLYIMLVIGLTTWPGNARLMRAQALTLRERTFTQAARAIGEGNLAIIFKYIVPNGIYPIIANTTLRMAGAILTEASLSFLGLGDPNVVSWGKMIFEGRTYITSAWWAAFFPGLAIVVTVMAFYFIGDGLNFALDPKARRDAR